MNEMKLPQTKARPDYETVDSQGIIAAFKNRTLGAL